MKSSENSKLNFIKPYFDYFLLITIFIVLQKFIVISSKLNESDYAADIILFASFDNLKFIALLVFNIISLYFLIKKKTSWDSIDHNKIIKPFIILLSFVLVWKYSTYDYNYYYDSFHLLDRLIIVVLFVALWKNPAFIIPLYSYILIILHQFHQPVPGFSFTDQMPLFDKLILFGSYLLLNSLKKIPSYKFIILLLLTHGANYFIPGIAKMEISPHLYEWALSNKMSNLFMSSYINGWLNQFSFDVILNIKYFIEKIEIPLQIGTLFIELIAIFILFKRKVTMLLLVSFALLHTGIVLSSGIFFWKWILLDALILLMVYSFNKDLRDKIYTKNNFIFSLLFILLSPFYLHQPSLAWFDSKLNNYFDIVIVDENNEKYKIHRNFFSPYDQIFAQSRFFYTTKNKTISGTYGSIGHQKTWYTDLAFSESDNKSDYKIYDLIEKSKSEDIPQLIDTYGNTRFNDEKTKKLKKFFMTYLNNYNEAPHKKDITKSFGAPYHIYSTVNKNYEKSRIKKLNFYYSLKFFKDNKIETISREKVFEIDLKK